MHIVIYHVFIAIHYNKTVCPPNICNNSKYF